MVKNSQIKSRISAICIYIALILINIAYCPGIILTSTYKVIIGITTVVILIGILINLKRTYKFIFKTSLIPITLLLTYSSIVFCLTGIFCFNAYSNIFLSFTCFIFGFSICDSSPKSLASICAIYIFSAIFLGIYSIITNLGSFEISDTYAMSVKNSSSVLLGTAMILCLPLIRCAKKRLTCIFWICASTLLFICILTFRSRTCMLGVVLAYIIYLMRSKISIPRLLCNRITIFIALSIIGLTICLNVNFSSYIYDAIFAGKGANNVNSITSGRIHLFKYAWEFFTLNPLFGNLQQDRALPPIDNFILSQLTWYGIVGALWNLVAYIIVWMICIRGLFKSSIKCTYIFLTLLLLCITSITEGPFPFGPGTPVICSWTLLGWWYRGSKYPLTNI